MRRRAHRSAPSVTPRALRWFRHIACHGPQSSTYLHALTQDSHCCKDTSLRQMQKLREANLLALPAQQFATEHANFNPHIYDITDDARAQLFEAGDGEDYLPPTGHWVHGYMTACVTSSIEIMAGRQGIGYLPAHRILDPSKRDLSLRMETNRGVHRLIPDQLFALDYGGAYRVCAVEVDRSTEPKHSATARKSLAKTLDFYAHILERKSYREAYGISSNLLVLWVFASKRSEAAMLELLAERGGLVEQATLTQTVEGFYLRWRPPPLWAHLLESPWKRALSAPVHLARSTW